METKRKTALITGGTSGIGYQLAKLFAKDGYDLVIVAREQAELDETELGLKQENTGINVTCISKDLFEPQAAEEVYNEIRSKDIVIDVLVNDAGQGEYGKFWEIDLQRHLDIIQLNIISLTSLTHLFLKDMVARDSGKILQLASLVSKMPSPLLNVYGATKAYVYSLTQALINELQDTNVTMTALMPGVTDTDFFNKADGENTVGYKEGDPADPADVAKEGYEALMERRHRIITGAKNKMQAAMSNVMPDEQLAENMRKLNKDSNE